MYKTQIVKVDIESGEISNIDSFINKETKIFINNKLLEGKLYVDDSIKYIQYNFLSRYSYIDEIEFSDTKRIIGSSAFSSMYNLKKISIGYGFTPKSNKSFIFSHNNIDDVIFRDTAKYYPSHLFSYSTIKNLYLPENCDKVSYLLYSDISIIDNLIKKGSNYKYDNNLIIDEDTHSLIHAYAKPILFIPEGIEKIDTYALSINRYNIRLLYIPESVKKIKKQSIDSIHTIVSDNENIESFKDILSNNVGYIRTTKEAQYNEDWIESLNRRKW